MRHVGTGMGDGVDGAAVSRPRVDVGAAADVLPLLMAIVDPTRTVLWVNDTHRRWLGLEPDAVIGRSVLGLYPVDDHDAFHAAIETGLAGRQVVVDIVLTTGMRCRAELTPFRADPDDAACVAITLVPVPEPTDASDHLDLLMRHMPEHIYFKDADGRFTCLNDALARYMGLGHPAEAIGKTDFDFYPEADARRYHVDEERLLRTGEPLQGIVERCPTPEGEPHWYLTTKVPIRDRDGKINGLAGISRDITALHRWETLHAGEAEVLQQLATGKPLKTVLETLVRLIEGQADGLLGSILILDETGERLRHGAGPNLPEAYREAIDGVAIGPAVGSCGTAAHRNERVITEDIIVDPKWAGYRDLAMEHGLRACWSQPIPASDGSVLGTFALYYRRPRLPNEHELQLITEAAHVAGIAIERTKVERVRNLEQQQLQLLMDNIPDAIYFKDCESRFRRVNRAQAEYLGLTHPDEAIGRNDEEFFSPRAAASYRTDEQAIVATGIPVVGKIEDNGATGTEQRWFSTTKVPLRGPAGRILGIVGISRDITAYKRTQETLERAYEEVEARVHERTEELESVFKALPDLYFRLGDDTRIVDARIGPRADLDQAALVGQAFATLLPEEAQADFQDAFNRTRDDRDFVSFEFQRRTGDELRWHEARLIPFREAEVIAIVRDDTARKTAERSLVDTTARLQLVADSLPACISSLDAAGRFVFHNATSESWFGTGSLKGRQIRDVIGERTYAAIRHHLRAALAGQEVDFEAELSLRSGQRWVRATLVPARGEEAGGVYLLFADITARRHAEQQARRHQTELNEVTQLSTMVVMAAALCHELNQPLQAIVNYVEAGRRNLQRDGLDVSTLLTDLDSVLEQAERAAAIMRRLRQSVREPVPARETLDLSAHVEAFVRDIEPEAVARGVIVTTDLDRNLRAVNANRTQLDQVLSNLCRNAIEAMAGADLAQPVLTLRTTGGPETVEVVVSDNGPGLPDSQLEHLFDPFFTTKSAGMGIGLSLARRIIEAHGGRLDYRGGSGASFGVVLPIREGVTP